MKIAVVAANERAANKVITEAVSRGIEVTALAEVRITPRHKLTSGRISSI